MDFNDLTLRLERVYSSIGKSTDGEIQKYIQIRPIENSDDPKYTLMITFDKGQSEPETTNIVFVIIEHLAKLKDHLKYKLGQHKNLVEKRIDKSLDLQLIMDLSNAEKHGYPLKRPERSKRSPQIQNIRYGLAIPPQEKVGINIETGEVVDDGSCRIVITADIVDSSGNFICKWPNLMKQAIQEWEDFILEHDIN